MVIYHYVERILIILVTPNFLYNIHTNQKYHSGEAVNIHIHLYFYIVRKINSDPLSLFRHFTILPSTISPLHHCTILLVSCPIPDFYTKIPDFYANILCYLGFYTRYCTWCVGGGEGSCVSRSLLQPHTWCYPGVQYNLISWYPIPGPGLVPVPAGDWGTKLRGSSVSRTSQQR